MGSSKYAALDRERRRRERAGCVQLRRSNTTHTEVGIYYADAAGFDPAAGKWITVCEDHGAICNHETLARAREHAPHVEWCEVCMHDDEPDGNFDDFDKLY